MDLEDFHVGSGQRGLSASEQNLGKSFLKWHAKETQQKACTEGEGPSGIKPSLIHKVNSWGISKMQSHTL